MRVFCISDSLGLPRPGVSYEDTWYYMLQKEYPSIEFYPFFIRRTTTDSLKLIFSDYVDYFNPNLVIVQLGICDCAPRIINNNKLFWKAYFGVWSLLGATNFAWKIVKTLYGRNNPSRVEVSCDKFRDNIQSFVRNCSEKNIKVLYVKIGRPSSSIHERSPYLGDNISLYNSCIDSIMDNNMSTVNPLLAGDGVDYIEDGYHTSKKGSVKVFESIRDSRLIECFKD